MAFTELNVNGARVSNVGTPTENTDAANKQYVDEKVPEITAGNGIAYSDGTVSVKAKASGGIIVDAEGVSVDAATMPMPDNAAPTNNPTFTGNVTVPEPTQPTDAARKDYVDEAVSGVEELCVKKSGDTMSGTLVAPIHATSFILGGTTGVTMMLNYADGVLTLTSSDS